MNWRRFLPLRALRSGLLPIARRFGVYAVAGVAGTLAAWLSYQHIAQREQALEAQARVPMVERVVAARDLDAGETLRLDALAVRDVPIAWASSDSIAPQDLDLLDGGVLSVSVKAGEPLLKHQVLRAKSDPVSQQLTEGRRAFSLPMSEIHDLPQHVQVGDGVDLYVSFEHGGQTVTVPLLQGGKVLAIEARDGAAQADSITLEAAANDALKVVAARHNGVLTALLRPASSEARDVLHGTPQDFPALLGLPKPVRKPGVDIIYGDKLNGRNDAEGGAHE